MELNDNMCFCFRLTFGCTSADITGKNSVGSRCHYLVILRLNINYWPIEVLRISLFIYLYSHFKHFYMKLRVCWSFIVTFYLFLFIFSIFYDLIRMRCVCIYLYCTNNNIDTIIALCYADICLPDNCTTNCRHMLVVCPILELVACWTIISLKTIGL